MINVIAEFIPIITIFLFLSFTDYFQKFSYTYFGKLLAILIISFYTYLDMYLGILVCLITICYYQEDLTSNLLNDKSNNNINSKSNN